MSEIPLAVNVKQAQRLLGGISRSSIYRLEKKKRLIALSLFKRNKLFPYSQILDLLK